MKNFYLGDNYWEKVKIGAGPIPIKTKDGWILIYHGVQSTCNGLNYSVGVALLDLNDPSKVLKRAGRYLLTAEKDYEKTGFTPNVCFPCSALCNSKGQVTIYYGVADTNMAIAFTTTNFSNLWINITAERISKVKMSYSRLIAAFWRVQTQSPVANNFCYFSGAFSLT